eukprot:1707814-Alexandrium_andersonii.AAC.1
MRGPRDLVAAVVKHVRCALRGPFAACREGSRPTVETALFCLIKNMLCAGRKQLLDPLRGGCRPLGPPRLAPPA